MLGFGLKSIYLNISAWSFLCFLSSVTNQLAEFSLFASCLGTFFFFFLPEKSSALWEQTTGLLRFGLVVEDSRPRGLQRKQNKCRHLQVESRLLKKGGTLLSASEQHKKHLEFVLTLTLFKLHPRHTNWMGFLFFLFFFSITMSLHLQEFMENEIMREI